MVALSVAAVPLAAGPEEPGPVVWVLHDGKAGMASQALGLAEATGFAFRERPLSIGRPWRWLPPQLWLLPERAASQAGAPLAPPWPDLVIACGRNAALPALSVRRAGAGRTLAVQVQDPRVGRGEFDLLFVPQHDRWRGPRSVVTRAALRFATSSPRSSSLISSAASWMQMPSITPPPILLLPRQVRSSGG